MMVRGEEWMKIKKRAAFSLVLAICAGWLAVLFPARAAEAAYIEEKKISVWAREGVAAAYEAGLLTQSFDLGNDYSVYITRLQLARLAVDFVASEKDMSANKLAEEYQLVYQAPADEDPAADEIIPPEHELPAEDESPAGIEKSGQSELPELNTGSFPDTKSAYAELTLKLNIMKGSDGLFRPNDLVTRAEAAAVLQRCMAALGVTEANKAPISFTDTYAIPRWAVEAVKFVSGRTDSGGTALMGGTGGLFAPDGRFTIEQAILTLLRMHDSMSVEDVYPGWRDAPGYNQVQVALTFGGDCTFGRGLDFGYRGSFDEMYDLMGANYFFSGIQEFFSDDLTMVNFEGTLTNATRAAVKTFVFKGRPEYAKILPAGSIDVVTVANNHSMDYLQQGFQDTLQNLSPYVAVSGYERMPIVTVKGVNIGFASNVGWVFDEAQKAFIRDAVQSLRAAGADLVVFNFHWGIERTYSSNATQRAIARYCIDQGADLVIGHHPHVVQETETYKGKQIVYSLGNLVFGGNQNPADKNCLIFSQTFTLDLDTRAVVSETHEAIPYRVSSVTWRNDYHPVPAG
jgi:poly-gamma-glutamate synthesis protein (capsule biosynthesis protein)